MRTLEERERLAYIEGRTEEALPLGELIDAEGEIGALEDRIAELEDRIAELEAENEELLDRLEPLRRGG